MPLEEEVISFEWMAASELIKWIAAVIGANESVVVEFPKFLPKAAIMLWAISTSSDLIAKAVVLLPFTSILFSDRYSLVPHNSIP